MSQNWGALQSDLLTTYWANGLQNTLNANVSGLPNWTYSADGEGRWNAVSACAGQNPVSSTSYGPKTRLSPISRQSPRAAALRALEVELLRREPAGNSREREFTILDTEYTSPLTSGCE